MAELKITMILLNWLGFPLYGYILLNYWGTFESVMMMILGGIFAMVKIIQAIFRLYFFWVKSKQDVRMRELKIEEKENEIHEDE